jgi:glycine cleavage system protein P-like pyridoxal-binding family
VSLKNELDRFINAMIHIRKEIDLIINKEMDPLDNPLKMHPIQHYL